MEDEGSAGESSSESGEEDAEHPLHMSPQLLYKLRRALGYFTRAEVLEYTEATNADIDNFLKHWGLKYWPDPSPGVSELTIGAVRSTLHMPVGVAAATLMLTVEELLYICKKYGFGSEWPGPQQDPAAVHPPSLDTITPHLGKPLEEAALGLGLEPEEFLQRLPQAREEQAKNLQFLDMDPPGFEPGLTGAGLAARTSKSATAVARERGIPTLEVKRARGVVAQRASVEAHLRKLGGPQDSPGPNRHGSPERRRQRRSKRGEKKL